MSAARSLFLLPEGSRFRLAEMPEVTGELVRASDCSCTVKVDGGVKDVQIEDHKGVVRRFTAHRTKTTTWAPATLVEPIFIPEIAPEASSQPEAAPAVVSKPEESDMSKKAKTTATTTTIPGGKGKTKTKAAKKAPVPKAPKTPKPAKKAAKIAARATDKDDPKPAKAKKEPKAKKVSALDAAAQVLKAKPGIAMHTTVLVEEMEKQGLWKSPGGKTPAATLYSAIIREIASKGNEARFKKVDAGTFVAA